MPRTPKSPDLKVSTLDGRVLMTSRAALIWLFIASITCGQRDHQLAAVVGDALAAHTADVVVDHEIERAFLAGGEAVAALRADDERRPVAGPPDQLALAAAWPVEGLFAPALGRETVGAVAVDGWQKRIEDQRA